MENSSKSKLEKLQDNLHENIETIQDNLQDNLDHLQENLGNLKENLQENLGNLTENLQENIQEITKPRVIELGSTNTKIYLKTLPGIVKTVALVVLLIAIILGFCGHFGSNARERWNDDKQVKILCDNSSNITKENKLECPKKSMQNEKIFLSLTIIFFIPTFIGIGVCSIWMWKYDELPPKTKIYEAFYHILAGLVLHSAGVFMITSPIQIEEFELKVDTDKSGSDFDLSNYRAGHKLFEKVAAGVLAFLSGIIYEVVACALLK